MLWQKLPCILRTQCSVTLSTLAKRPPNPYQSFVSDKFKEESILHPPRTPSKDIMKCLARKWNELPSADKSVYQERYSDEMKKFSQENTYLSPLPKRPGNPFTYYASDNFQAEKSHHPPNTHSKHIVKSLGGKWKNLSSTQKEVYNQKVSADWKKYDQFFTRAPLNTLNQIQDEKEKKIFMKKLVENGRLPKKPPLSGYNLFISRNFKADSNVPNSEIIVLLAQKYQRLTESEKSALAKEVELMKEGYNSNMNRMFNS